MSIRAKQSAGLHRCAVAGVALLITGVAACGDENATGDTPSGTSETSETEPEQMEPEETTAPDTSSADTGPADTVSPTTATPTTVTPTTVTPTTVTPTSGPPTTVPSTTRPPTDPPRRGSAMIDTAIADMASRRSIDADAITVVSSEDVTWRNGAIGCPRKDMNYTMALVPGTRIVLEADGVRDVYHSGNGGAPFYCAVPEAPLDAVDATTGGASGDV